MTIRPAPRRLDVQAFALAQGHLEGADPLERYERLVDAAADHAVDGLVTWDARGASTRDALGGTQCWLHLKVQTRLALTCQRCLGRLMWPVDVERAFRFVADEATAEEQDETSEEDVLVLTADLDLQSLIEDEVLLSLPYVPRHADCPEQPTLSATDENFDRPAPKPHPFAALASLKLPRDKSSG